MFLKSVVVSVGVVAAVVLAPPHAVAKVPPTPDDLPDRVEPYAPYVGANSCSKRAQPGARAFGELLVATWPKTHYSTGRTCTTARSEHHDGRAVDWMTSVREKYGKKRARDLLRWLLRSDAAGNPAANARRLGVMYLIWNNRIWSSYRASDGWRAYSNCASAPQRSADTRCHRDHVHVSLSWAGARGRTSFYDSTYAGNDYGPCRPADLAWASRWTSVRRTPCPWYPEPRAPSGSSSLHRSLVTYSGLRISAGMSGPAVTVVQRALKLERTGRWGRSSRTAMREYKRARSLGGNAVVGPRVWRSLLARTAP
ncbi:UNVERIFIED_CONTAM: hypothetical protein LK11_09690 [Mumia flava]|uniref:hypothetical protein n=1 Tax=Mumia flava TaxID=1348852 RepID=UPI0005731040|nr:hypothetical protein [Mumia flava]